jgi:hypothetical protein
MTECCYPGCTVTAANYTHGPDGRQLWACEPHLDLIRRDLAERKERSNERARRRRADKRAQLGLLSGDDDAIRQG